MFLIASAIFVSARVQGVRQDPIIGRWDLSITKRKRVSAGWLEVRASGLNTLVGRTMIGFGSARPVSNIIADPSGFHFEIPTQWESNTGTMKFEGHLIGGNIVGSIEGPVFGGSTVTGKRAPSLDVTGPVVWDRPEKLIGKNLEDHWIKTPGWIVEKGSLVNKNPRQDIVSSEKFTDFKAHLEFKYPEGSNSGIYLRGRYEVQIDDAYGLPADDEHSGGVYGLIQPRVNASKKPNEWQAIDITFVGRTVSVTLNGEKIIENQEIAGPTGGALDSDEAAPGPLKLQGDHGPIEFRNITIWRRKSNR
jgi:hypothetical protein